MLSARIDFDTVSRIISIDGINDRLLKIVPSFAGKETDDSKTDSRRLSRLRISLLEMIRLVVCNDAPADYRSDLELSLPLVATS